MKNLNSNREKGTLHRVLSLVTEVKPGEARLALLFTLNFKMWADKAHRQDLISLLEMAAERDVGTMAIKALTRGPWGDQDRRYHTWYEPFDQPEEVEKALRFTLSQPITGAISAGDARLVPLILESAEHVEPMNDAEQAQTIADAAGYQPLFT